MAPGMPDFMAFPTPTMGPETGDTSVANSLQASSVAVALQIEVVGSDLDGQQYIERTQTLTITRDGATILLANKLAPESELLVRNPLTNEEAVVRVVGHIRKDASGHVYGVVFMDPGVDFWHVQFSPKPTGRLRIDPAPAESGKRTALECSRCHAVRVVALTEIEIAIFESKRALTRPCTCSNSSTIWKLTTREAAAEQGGISVGASAGPESALVAVQEKRKDKRTAVKFTACIRYAGQEEVAVCEDMSRGGFRFKGRKKYLRGTQIEAAVPYAPSNVNIFVQAQIAFHQELSPVAHRHGVSYLKTIKIVDQK
jgi:hypothetical protein